MKKLVSSVLVALTMLLVLGSCGSTKNVAYFQNADSISLAASRMLYEAKIMPKDELTITVITTGLQQDYKVNSGDYTMIKL
jgi:polysaccharide export outer membrane protein